MERHRDSVSLATVEAFEKEENTEPPHGWLKLLKHVRVISIFPFILKALVDTN